MYIVPKIEVREAEDIADLFRRGHEPCPFRVGCTRTIGTFMLADLLKSFGMLPDGCRLLKSPILQGLLRNSLPLSST